VICVRGGKGARRRPGTCHASYRNSLKSFEKFFGICDEFRIQNQAHIYSKDL